MQGWLGAAFIVALVSAIFGFTALATGAAEVARVVFFVMFVFCLIALIITIFRGR